MTPINEFQDALSGGNRKIGALVYWSGLNAVRIPRPEFRGGFEGCGLGDAVGRDPLPETCLNRAAATANRGQPRSDVAGKVELTAKHNFAVYAVLMRRDLGARVQYLEEARISLERDQPNPVLTVSDHPDAPVDRSREDLIANVRAAYADIMANATTLEVSEAMVAAMELVGSLSVRTGVYFVPEASMGRVRALQAWLATVGVRLTAWEIGATEANAAEARRDAREAFIDKVRATAEECRAFVASKDEPNMKSINARIKRFKDLDSQVALYSEILGDFQDEMQAAIDSARDSFMAELGLADDAAA